MTTADSQETNTAPSDGEATSLEANDGDDETVDKGKAVVLLVVLVVLAVLVVAAVVNVVTVVEGLVARRIAKRI